MARKDSALEVRARLEDDPDGGVPPDEIVVYAFAANGKLLDSQPLSDGVTRLKVPIGEAPVPGRVLIGPRVGDDVPLIDELLRRGAWEEHIRLEPKLPPLDILIPSPDWLCWILSRCTVRGTLLKRTVRNGVTVDLPVCDADVEIYEVDPLPILIPRLPDDILDRIRDILVKQPIPIPDPADPDPGPILPRTAPARTPRRSSRCMRSTLRPRRRPSSSRRPPRTRCVPRSSSRTRTTRSGRCCCRTRS